MYNIIFRKMGKKVVLSKEKKLNNRLQIKSLTFEELKAYALKKIPLIHKKKSQSSKISKLHSEQIQVPKRSFKVQKQSFNDIIDQSTYQCPVCLELMIEPTLLQCGHAYCAKCIQELMIYKSTCGVCRNVQKQPEFLKSKYLETIIEKIIISKSSNYLDYYCRVTDAQNWKKVRDVSIQQLNKGSFIDFRDQELKWRKGQIGKIFFIQEKGHYQMQIKYIKDGQNTIEIINSQSDRYAKFTYYTRMKYLEPKPITLAFQNRISDQILYTPLTNSFREFPGEIIENFDHQHEETIQSVLQQNIEFERTANEIFYFEPQQFLNQIFQTQNHEALDVIQLLA